MTKTVMAGLMLAAACITQAASEVSLDDYNIVWTNQSKNSSESMPCGGGDIGLQVWVENDELLFYMQRIGCFDENSQILRLGRVRVRVTPNPFKDATFRQELKLKEGYVEVSGVSVQVSGGDRSQRPELRRQKSPDTRNLTPETLIRVWVEVFRPIIHVEVDSKTPVSVEASYETWRTEKRKPTDSHQCRGVQGWPGPLYTYPDTVAVEGDRIEWYHRNRDDDLAFDKAVALQQLDAYKDRIRNPLKHRTFGGSIGGAGMVPAGTGSGEYADTPFTSWTLKSASAATSHRLNIALVVGQYPTVKDWRTTLGNYFYSSILLLEVFRL